jgi:hypothetical protein
MLVYRGIGILNTRTRPKTKEEKIKVDEKENN